MSCSEVEAAVKSCILSRKGGVPLSDIDDDYRELVGENIPFSKLGYESLEKFLSSLTGIQLCKGYNGSIVLKVYDDKTAHIADLVDKQKSTSNRTKKKSTHVATGKMRKHKERMLNYDKYPFSNQHSKSQYSSPWVPWRGGYPLHGKRSSYPALTRLSPGQFNSSKLGLSSPIRNQQIHIPPFPQSFAEFCSNVNTSINQRNLMRASLSAVPNHVPWAAASRVSGAIPLIGPYNIGGAVPLTVPPGMVGAIPLTVPLSQNHRQVIPIVKEPQFFANKSNVSSSVNIIQKKSENSCKQAEVATSTAKCVEPQPKLEMDFNRGGQKSCKPTCNGTDNSRFNKKSVECDFQKIGCHAKQENDVGASAKESTELKINEFKSTFREKKPELSSKQTSNYVEFSEHLAHQTLQLSSYHKDHIASYNEHINETESLVQPNFTKDSNEGRMVHCNEKDKTESQNAKPKNISNSELCEKLKRLSLLIGKKYEKNNSVVDQSESVSVRNGKHLKTTVETDDFDLQSSSDKLLVLESGRKSPDGAENEEKLQKHLNLNSDRSPEKEPVVSSCLREKVFEVEHPSMPGHVEDDVLTVPELVDSRFSKREVKMEEGILSVVLHRKEPSVEPLLQDCQLLGDDFLLNLAYGFLPHLSYEWEGKDLYRCGLCVSGQTIRDCFRRVRNYNFMADNVLLLLGVIDIVQGTSLSKMKSDFLELLDCLLCKVQNVVILTLPPLIELWHISTVYKVVKKFNEWLIQLDTDVNVHVIDTWPLYFDEDGYLREELFEKFGRRIFGCDGTTALWNHRGRKEVLGYFQRGILDLPL